MKGPTGAVFVPALHVALLGMDPSGRCCIAANAIRAPEVEAKEKVFFILQTEVVALSDGRRLSLGGGNAVRKSGLSLLIIHKAADELEQTF